MEFRLTYQGPLFSTQQRPREHQADRRAPHKHTLRQVFHRQLRRLWEVTPFLTGRGGGPSALLLSGPDEPPDNPSREDLARRFALYGFNFVPLVTEGLDLICGLDILFLRRGAPGHVVTSGDIDNRLKTLFDALSLPRANEGYSDLSPGADETPFYCLLEDDRLITKISVETDQLLEEVGDPPSDNDVRLVITVRLRPHELHLGNLRFG